MSRLDEMMIGAKLRMNRFLEDAKGFLKSESGVSNVVATVILVLIVVMLIALFWKELSTWLTGMMGKIFETEFTEPTITTG